MVDYFDTRKDFQDLKRVIPSLVTDGPGFNAKQVRAGLLSLGFHGGRILRYMYRPMDTRWIYWEPESGIVDRSRPDYVVHCRPANPAIFTTARTRKNLIEPPVVTVCVADINLLDSSARGFPLYLNAPAIASKSQAHLELDFTGGKKKAGPQPNLTDNAEAYVEKLDCEGEDLFFHIVAVLHSPAYREENSGALRQDWPRVPLPKEAKTLRAGATLGREVAALLDPETPVPGVTDLKVRPTLKGLGELTVTGAGKKGKPQPPDLNLTARWGYAGQGGVVMPGPGKVTPGTRGEGFLDIHLNPTTCWKDVPEAVWNYTLGGYQVLKKWLSYRESPLLGRPLTAEEAHDFTHHTRRIAAILEMHPALDAHYRASV